MDYYTYNEFVPTTRSVAVEDVQLGDVLLTTTGVAIEVVDLDWFRARDGREGFEVGAVEQDGRYWRDEYHMGELLEVCV